MVLGPAIINIAKTVFKYRKHIYRTLMAQDRAIDKAFKVGGYGRQVRYGARHGATGGALIGTLITNNADDSPGNGFQKPYTKQYPSRTPYKARGRYPVRFDSRDNRYNRPDKYGRCPSPRKPVRRRNRF